MSDEALPRPQSIRAMAPEEPFRVFFPLAMLAGIVGVALWPLFYADLLPFFPGIAHARVMITGFFGAFVLGFLGTAGPRMIEVPHLARGQLAALLGLWTLYTACYCAGWIMAGDALFLGTNVFAAALATQRCRLRKDVPPPGFSLVVMGLFAAFLSVLVLLLVSLLGDQFPFPWFWYAFATLTLNQGAILLAILGVAPFFFPRFGGLKSRQAQFPESRTPPPGWLPKAGTAGAVGLLLIASYAIEAGGQPIAAAILRLLVLAVYVVREVPLRYPRGEVGTLGRIVQTGTICVILGSVLPAFFPAQRVALLHVLFIGGYALIALSVGTWVIFGHSGVRHLGSAKLRFARWAFGLLLLAMATRVSAEVFPWVQVSHHVYAALVWILALAIWAVYVVPRVRLADPEE